MKLQSKLKLFIGLIGVVSTVAVANPVNKNTINPAQLNPMIGSGATQFVIVMNALANPANLATTQSDILIKYYDGTGNNPPCWTEHKVTYHSEPMLAAAGGRNACGKSGVLPAAIVKIDVVPLKMGAGKMYHDLLDIPIDPNKFYNTVIVEQAIAPVFNSDGSLKTPGILKVKQSFEGK
ncbi:MAG TPA: hypothetical protein VHZ76_08265 [Gammaproteobacteria bacterium]|jgi:hypothetical protein|nr:hypothetical protein [Gammaproteobacteria bacterium]